MNQCDNNLTGHRRTVSGNSGDGFSKNKNRNKISNERYAELMMKHLCRMCDGFGHWAKEHRENGSLPHGVKLVGKNETTNSNESEDKTSDKTKRPLGFSNGSLRTKILSNSSGNMLEILNMDHFLRRRLNTQPLVKKLSILAAENNIPDFALTGPIREAIKEYTHSQYGSGEHASGPKCILRSIVWHILTDKKRMIHITLLVLKDDGQWVIGRSVKQFTNIEHSIGDKLGFFFSDKNSDLTNLH